MPRKWELLGERRARCGGGGVGEEAGPGWAPEPPQRGTARPAEQRGADRAPGASRAEPSQPSPPPRRPRRAGGGQNRARLAFALEGGGGKAVPGVGRGMFRVLFWSREAGSTANAQTPADGAKVPVRGQSVLSFLLPLRHSAGEAARRAAPGIQLSCPSAGLSMNQTAGVTNNVRCSSKGSKVRLARGLRGSRRPVGTGLGEARSGRTGRLPPALLPVPKPVAENVFSPRPGQQPPALPACPSLGEVEHLSLAPRRPGLGASSSQRCSGRAGTAPRAPPRRGGHV